MTKVDVVWGKLQAQIVVGSLGLLRMTMYCLMFKSSS